MTKLMVSKRVEAPLDVVFDVFSNIEKAADSVSGIERVEMLTPGPVCKGTRFRETRRMFKKECTEEMEFTEFEPQKYYTVTAESCGARYETRFDFRSDADATVVDVAMNVQPISFFAKLMSPVGRLMMGPMKKCIDKDMSELAEIAKAKHPSGGSQAASG